MGGQMRTQYIYIQRHIYDAYIHAYICTPALRFNHPARVSVTCPRYILCRPTQTYTYNVCVYIHIIQHTHAHMRTTPPTHTHRALRRVVPWRFLARYAEIHPDPHPTSIMTAGRVERSSGISCRGGCVCVCVCARARTCPYVRVCVCVRMCVCVR